MEFHIADIETSGLSPELGSFVTAIGFLNNSGVRINTSTASLYRANFAEAERQTLRAFAPMRFEPDDVLVTFNGISFVVPFLQKRFAAMLPGLSFSMPTKHIDLMYFAKEMNGGIRISKDMAASKFGNVYVPHNSNGAYLAEIYSTHIVSDVDHMLTQLHLAQDLFVTAQLFEKWKTFPRFRKSCVDNFGIDLETLNG